MGASKNPYSKWRLTLALPDPCLGSGSLDKAWCQEELLCYLFTHRLLRITTPKDEARCCNQASWLTDSRQLLLV